MNAVISKGWLFLCTMKCLIKNFGFLPKNDYKQSYRTSKLPKDTCLHTFFAKIQVVMARIQNTLEDSIMFRIKGHEFSDL